MTPARSDAAAVTTVLLVDDHPIVRAGCQRLLADAGGFHVVEAEDAEQALTLYREAAPAVVVMDLSMPGRGGMEAMQGLFAEDPHALVLVFSMHDDPIFAARALRAGARGYVSKNDDPDTLVTAIRRVLGGGIHLGDAMARDLAVLGCAPQRHSLYGLSQREFAVMTQPATGASVAEIAGTLSVSEKTVYNNCTRIKDKLSLRSTRDLYRAAFALLHGTPG